MSSEFWEMGGYAVYVWGSYAAAFVVFAWNVVAVRSRRREILRQLREAEERQES
jgi:heme exporter protein D